MKKIAYLFSSLLLIIVSNVYAMEYKPGPYLGGQVGWGRIDEGGGYKDYVNPLTSREIKLGEFGGWRAYGGYSFIPFFSIEAGYNYYPDNTYTATSTNINVKTYAIDLVGKIIIPLGMIAKHLYHFSIYGKGGGRM